MGKLENAALPYRSVNVNDLIASFKPSCPLQPSFSGHLVNRVEVNKPEANKVEVNREEVKYKEANNQQIGSERITAMTVRKLNKIRTLTLLNAR